MPQGWTAPCTAKETPGLRFKSADHCALRLGRAGTNGRSDALIQIVDSAGCGWIRRNESVAGFGLAVDPLSIDIAKPVAAEFTNVEHGVFECTPHAWI